MGDFAVAVFAVAVVGVPVGLVLATQQRNKRGCGRGCASCGNRHLCHPGQYPRRETTPASHTDPAIEKTGKDA